MYIDDFFKIANENSDFRILADDNNPLGITYGDILDMSGRVYAYLKENGIGKEDVVMIFLPRGILPIIAFIGVIRNGSVFLIVEDTYEPERVEFIKKDCNCKLIIDRNVWDKIMKTDPIEGFESVDEHDGAMIFYTSGSTGRPKGVLHEYGNIDRTRISFSLTLDDAVEPDDRFAILAPLNFIAAQSTIITCFYNKTFFYIVSYDDIKNLEKLNNFLLTNNITCTFLSPRHLKKMAIKPPTLRWCTTGSETVSNVYVEGLKIYNDYSMTEAAFAVCCFEIDKKYDLTPVGKPMPGHKVIIMGEDGNPVIDGEKGEICFENKYVRGYINLPDETKKHFVDGIYHTGDLAYKDKNGNIVIVGRLSDMVKVNGNRVEPGEIEEVCKRVFGIDFAACRIFQDEKNCAICLYYTAKELPFSVEESKEKLSKYLPYYMIPNFFIHIDSVPIKASGKMDRNALPRPRINSFLAKYVAPRDEIEEKLCRGFEKALSIDKIGIDDDFYSLGGDSLSVMSLLVEADIADLDIADIFLGKTPRGIADVWKKSHPLGVVESINELDERARQKEHPLTAYQIHMIDYQLYTPMSTMLNLNMMVKLKIDDIDAVKFKAAVDTAIANHPALMTKFLYNDNGDLVQLYEPSYAPDTRLQELEMSDFELLKNDLIKPFKIINSCLYRSCIYKVENDVYLFFDVHHTIFDGTSFRVLFNDIIKSYYGKQCEPDMYYGILELDERCKNSQKYSKAEKYFHENYDGDFYSTRPKLDYETRENRLGSYSISLNDKNAKLSLLEEKANISRNVLFNLVTMMSVAIYNRKPDVQITWAYNGRDDVIKNNTVGLLLKDLPIKLQLKKSQKITDIYKDVQKQVIYAIANSCYPYTTVSSRTVTDDKLCFLYQRNIKDAGDQNIDIIELTQSRAAAENIIDVQVIDDSTGLGLTIDYMSSLYDKNSIESFAHIFVSTFENLLGTIEHDDATVEDLIKLITPFDKERNWF